MTDRIDRRALLAGAAALGAASALPARALAQGKTLVAATFPGTWNEAHRKILAPAFRKRDRRVGDAVDHPRHRSGRAPARPPRAAGRRSTSRSSIPRRCSTPPSRD